MKTIVIHHSADYDGIFCRKIARKFLPDAELIGWDHGDAPVKPTRDYDRVFVLDLPCDRPLGIEADKLWPGCSNLIWIDHHKSAIDSHPPAIPGYRIDGVAACRLAWQWFQKECHEFPLNAGKDNCQMPTKEDFVNRVVREPLAVRLAGEYDVWDHRDNDADIAFQFGLDSQEGMSWEHMLRTDEIGEHYARGIVLDGHSAMQCYAKRDADILRGRSFITAFAGLRFLALNTARCNSNTFAARDKPETGHEALLGFYWNGEVWIVSMYHAAHRKDLDLSQIAVKYGGGGHRDACGFRTDKLPFL